MCKSRVGVRLGKLPMVRRTVLHLEVQTLLCYTVQKKMYGRTDGRTDGRSFSKSPRANYWHYKLKLGTVVAQSV
jgi:hypothetical protein